MAAPLDLLRKVPLFEGLSKRELEQLSRSFKENRFSAGAEIATKGQRGVGFFVIGEGEVSYTVEGAETGRGGAGDYFGEVALIDDGARTATITAKTPLKCYGITSWEFRPLVESNAKLAWKMLETMAKRLRGAEQRAG